MMAKYTIIFLLLLFTFNRSYSQSNFCWYSYKPLLEKDSTIINTLNIQYLSIFQIHSESKKNNDTVFVKKINLKSCNEYINEDFEIKKSRVKSNKIKQVIEFKYSGNKYKLKHYFNSKDQISKTTNKLIKGSINSDWAFSKIRYYYDKEGLLHRAIINLRDFKIDGKENLFLIFKHQ